MHGNDDILLRKKWILVSWKSVVLKNGNCYILKIHISWKDEIVHGCLQLLLFTCATFFDFIHKPLAVSCILELINWSSASVMDIWWMFGSLLSELPSSEHFILWYLLAKISSFTANFAAFWENKWNEKIQSFSYELEF